MENPHDDDLAGSTEYDNMAGFHSEALRDDPEQLETDAAQTAQIKKLSRKVLWTSVVAAFGPLLALAGLVFAALQWHAADGQLRLMESQLRDARDGALQAQKATEEVVAATKSQADSMKTLAETNSALVAIAQNNAVAAQDSGRIEQRAWVGVESVASEKPTLGKPVNILVTIKNSGRSPATDIEQYYIWAGLPVGTEQTLIRMGPRLDRNGRVISHSTLFPGISTPILLTTSDATDEQMRLLNSKQMALHVYGKISYRDIFKRLHWTTYCFYTFGESQYWNVCGAGNSTE